jgi:hypothetical protein
MPIAPGKRRNDCALGSHLGLSGAAQVPVLSTLAVPRSALIAPGVPTSRLAGSGGPAGFLNSMQAEVPEHWKRQPRSPTIR